MSEQCEEAVKAMMEIIIADLECQPEFELDGHLHIGTPVGDEVRIDGYINVRRLATSVLAAREFRL